MPLPWKELIPRVAKLTPRAPLARVPKAVTDGIAQALERAAAQTAAALRAAVVTPKTSVPRARPSPGAATAGPSAATVAPSTTRDGGVAPPAAVATFATASHTFEGMTRRYKLYRPATASRAPGLVVMLHGCTQDSDDFAVGTRMNAAADTGGFLVVYPEQSRDANPSRCWNWFGKQEQYGGGEAAFVVDLTRRLIDSEAVDPARVYVAGMSAGGALAATLASRNPQLFAAAGIHSGLPAGAAGNVPDALLAMRSGPKRKLPSKVPTIVFHGDADRTVHPDNATATIDALLGVAPLATWSATDSDPRYTRTVYSASGGPSVAELWSLHGAGHAWAGGDARGSHTDPKGVDATGEMVRFFAEHRR